MTQIACDDKEMRSGFEAGKYALPAVQPPGPAGDVQVGEVQNNQTVKSIRETLAGEFEKVDMRLEKHRCVSEVPVSKYSGAQWDAHEMSGSRQRSMNVFKVSELTTAKQAKGLFQEGMRNWPGSYQ